MGRPRQRGRGDAITEQPWGAHLAGEKAKCPIPSGLYLSAAMRGNLSCLAAPLVKPGDIRPVYASQSVHSIRTTRGGACTYLSGRVADQTCRSVYVERCRRPNITARIRAGGVAILYEY